MNVQNRPDFFVPLLHDLKIWIAKNKKKIRKPQEKEPYNDYGQIRQRSPAMVGWDCSVPKLNFFQTELSAPSVGKDR
jgi:hypothetical protein